MDINQINSAIFSIGFAESFAANYEQVVATHLEVGDPDYSPRALEEAKELVAAIARIETVLMQLSKENQALINTLALIDIARKS
jgi:hypothetical protein